MWLDEVKDRLRKVEPVYREIQTVDTVGKKKRFTNKIELTAEEFEKLTGLAKSGIKAKISIDALEDRLRDTSDRYAALRDNFNRLKEETAPFIEAAKEAPEQVHNFLADILQKAKDAREQARREAERKKQEAQKRRESPWKVKPQAPPKPQPRNRSRDYER